MEENTNPTPKKGSKTGVTLSILAVIVIIAGALWYSFSGTNDNTNTTVNSNTNSTTNTNSTVDTSDWETYTNEGLNFSIKYPKDYRIDEGDIYIQVFSYPKGANFNTGSSVPQEEIKVVITIEDNITAILDKWVESKDFVITDTEIYSKDGNIAKKVWSTSEIMGSMFNNYQVYYKELNKGVVFTAYPDNSDKLDIFHKMFDSFDFN
jgi:hypothetical protein